MAQFLKPNGARDDALAYSPGVLVEGPARTVYVAGQVGVDAEGHVSPDFETQARQVWRNVEAVLAAGGLAISDIVKITTFLIDTKDFATNGKVRGEMLKGHKPASTLVYVSGLVKPEWRVEIEAVAVRNA